MTQALDSKEPAMVCPRCGSKLRYRRDGIFRWRYCPRTKACGWTVFNHETKN